MSNQFTGGPAFPVCDAARIHDIQGMFLRDYFAAKAMQGELAALCDPENEIYGLSLDASDDQLARLTKHCYRIADAMLKAREQ